MKDVQKGSIYIIVLFVVIFFIGVGLVFLIKNSLKPSSENNTPQVVHGLEDLGKKDSQAAPQHLVAGGFISGTMTQGKAGTGYVCTPSSVGPIVGYISGASYGLTIKGSSVTGPGVYTTRVQLGQVQNQNFTWSSDKATVTINADRRSGSVNATLTNANRPSEKVTLQGSWTCPQK